MKQSSKENEQKQKEEKKQNIQPYPVYHPTPNRTGDIESPDYAVQTQRYL
jgi:aspartate carbamoyltransferase catalytic subunit